MASSLLVFQVYKDWVPAIGNILIYRYTGLGLSITAETFDTNRMLVYFESDSSVTLQGFRAYFTGVICIIFT